MSHLCQEAAWGYSASQITISISELACRFSSRRSPSLLARIGRSLDLIFTGSMTKTITLEVESSDRSFPWLAISHLQRKQLEGSRTLSDSRITTSVSKLACRFSSRPWRRPSLSRSSPRIGRSLDQQWLIFTGKQLEDSRTLQLSDYDIRLPSWHADFEGGFLRGRRLLLSHFRTTSSVVCSRKLLPVLPRTH